MLNRLTINNYAIINELHIEFSGQLNVITGETGAGKSIIIGALGLILGQRAESSVLLNKEKKCIVEGFFTGEKNDGEVTNFLKRNELDLLDDLVVRREIAPGGKSRAFINDTPVNLTQLNALSSLLVDLHQQFDTLELNEADFQREVLDALAGNSLLLKQYKVLYLRLQTAKTELNNLKNQKTLFEKEADYNRFLFTELDEAAFTNNELEELDVELKMLSNAEGIKNALEQTNFQLQETEEPIVRQIKTLSNQLQPYANLHPQIPGLLQRLQSTFIELEDIADEASRINDGIGADANEIDKINERLSAGYRLLKKHGVKTTNDLLQIHADLNEKLQAVLNIDEAISRAETVYAQVLLESEKIAAKISAARQQQIKPLEQKVEKMLAQVGMPNAKLKVDMKAHSLNLYGSDEVVFLFDANKKNQFLPLGKVASGGELSRLMLCIKSLVATSMNLPTLIFDEIDTGISGEAARQVGIIMKDLAAARQIMCITHQPQLAGKADAHFLVYKGIEKNAVTTGVRLLNKDERIVAIAKMLSGERPTAAALENAREMVGN